MSALPSSVNLLSCDSHVIKGLLLIICVNHCLVATCLPLTFICLLMTFGCLLTGGIYFSVVVVSLTFVVVVGCIFVNL